MQKSTEFCKTIFLQLKSKLIKKKENMTQRSAKQYRFTGRQEKERENCGEKKGRPYGEEMRIGDKNNC